MPPTGKRPLSSGAEALVRFLKAHAGRLAVAGLLAAWIGTAWHEAVKPLPAGLHLASAVCAAPAKEVSFIADITAAEAFGRAAVSQGIFDAVLAVVREARRFIVLDYAAFGASAGGAAPQRRIAAELTDALIERRREQPAVRVLFITDPANESFGAAHTLELQLLRAAGVEVVLAELDRLRDSNLAYSSAWRLALRWWATPRGPLGVTARRLNFKADDRRLVIADDGRDGLTAVIGSADPQDAESAWSNVAARVTGEPLRSLLASELAIARFSGWRGGSGEFLPPPAVPGALPAACTAAGGVPPAGRAPPAPAGVPEDTARVQVLTEGAICEALLRRVDATLRGDSIEVAMFHLAHREVIESLRAAAQRGVSVRLILDPNDGGTGGGVRGIPNQPAASELVAESGGALRVRWYRTHGERFHDALVMIGGAGRVWLLLGSAQLTRRSLGDYNLEADVGIESSRDAALAQQALQYFDTLWGNRAALGIEYTADFGVFANPAPSDYWAGRLLETAGLAPF